MWRKRIKRALIVVACLAAAAGVGLALLWRDRPDLEQVGWRVAPEAAETALSVTWLGATTLLFDDGETQILIDGFFSRPSLADGVLHRPVSNDAAMIDFAMHEFEMRRLAAIIPQHSHYDHAMDVGAIAKRSSASVIGSESVANIVRGAGVPEDQVVIARNGASYDFGQFTVRLVATRHARIGWRGTVPLPGAIDEPLTLPAPLSAMRVGEVWSIIVEHPQGTTLVHGSSGYVDGELDEYTVDLALLGTYGLSSLGYDYAEHYWQSMVTATGARVVVPIHFDDITKPFGEVTPFPRILDNIETAADWFEAFRDTWDVETKLYLPEFGRKMAVYAEPSSST